MATEIILPTLGETMDEGTIARWLVPSGTTVSKGQPIAEIESNKAVFELESPASGILIITKPAGVTVPILTVIGTILTPGETPPATGAQAATTAIPASTSGPMEQAATAQPSTTAGETTATAEALPVPGGRRFISPRARRFAQEKGVDLNLVVGSGPNRRVEERDVRTYLESQPRLSPLARKIAAEAGIVPSPAIPRARLMRADVAQQVARPITPKPQEAELSADVTPLGTIRRVIAQRMTQSAQTTASVTLTTEVDATELVHLREQIKDYVAQQTGEPLSYNVLLARLVAIALHEFPYMMSQLKGDEINTPTAVNIGIAVDTDRGLLVPVLRNVENKGLIALSQEVAALMKKARDGSITADDMTGGTFTITNLGMYGVDAFTPLINLPECAILGVGRIGQRPAVWQGQMAIRHMVVLSLTFDHRLVDGAPAARFLQRVAQLIQNPYVVLL